MDLDIVVVNHQTPDLFKACLNSIVQYMPPTINYKIFGVDNSPVDPVGEYKIENRGYGQACNYGVSLGKSEFLLLLNADVEMTQRSDMYNICKIFDEHPMVAIVGPKQISPKGWIASAGCPPMKNNGVGYTIRGWKEPDAGQYVEYMLDCMYVAGSVVFTRRSVYEELGGFLETPLYYEESYYCYLARHRGYRCIYTGQSLWLHHWDSSPKKEKHLLSGRAVALESHGIFVEALRREGVAENAIPPFC